MSQADKLYRNYFLEYASYVIRERAIPDIEDGEEAGTHKYGTRQVR